MNGLLLVLLVIYFLPALIALGKRNWLGVAVLNLLIGWTLIGWVVCFIWACASADAKPLIGARFFAAAPPPDHESAGGSIRSDDPVPAAGYIAAAIFIGFVVWAVAHGANGSGSSDAASAEPPPPTASAADTSASARCSAAFARAEDKHLLPDDIAADGKGGAFCTGGGLAYRIEYRETCAAASSPECVRVTSVLRVADGEYLFRAKN